MVHLILPRNFLGCHSNEIWDKIGYNSVFVRDICEIFASIGGFRDGPSNVANRIFPRPTLVAIETKFGTKWAITRHMYEIYPRFLHLTRGFKGKANK